MKTKGVSVLEKMIEKIVLAVALVIFLAVFAIQFLGSPTVDLPGGLGEVPVSQAAERIADAAETKQAELEGMRQLPQGLPAVPNLSDQLASRFGGPAVEPVQIANVVGPWPSIGDLDEIDRPIVSTGDSVYAVAEPVAPQNTTAAMLMATVDPSVPLLYPEAADLLPEQQPLDKAFVTVQVEWDAAANRARMNATPSDGELVLPQNWRNEMEIWDVELVRRELGSDGSWGPETVVPPMPGRASIRAMLADATPPDIASIAAEENALRAGLRQPRMYNLIAGDFWSVPVELAKAEDMERPADVERLLGQVRRIRSEIQQVQDQLDNLGGGRAMIVPDSQPGFFDPGAITPDSIRWPRFDDSARAQVGGGGGGGGDAPREDPTEQRRRALEQRLERLNTQLQQAIDRLNALGYDETGRLIDADDEEAVDYAASASVSVRDAETIDIWAHDLTAEPGATYQYAIRVRLRNPLFGNATAVAPAQQELAGQPVLASGLSPWSDPVEIPNLSEYFVTAAGDGSLGLAGNTSPSATVDAFRYYYGAWRRQTLRMLSGDSLVASIEIPDNLPIYEISRGEGGQLTLEGETTIETEDLEFRRDGFLLDVIAGAEQVVVAYFRLGDGRVVGHEPDAARDDPALARMRLDATAAAEQVFRPLDLTDTSTPRPGLPGPGPRPDPGDPGAPGAPAGPGAPEGPGAPGSPFG